MRIDFTYKDVSYHAQYDSFSLDSEEQDFSLHIAGYHGDAGDDLSYQDGRGFSTHDRDNSAPGTCASRFHVSGFWFKNCFLANLNGNWGDGQFSRGVNWRSVTGFRGSATSTEMKIRKKC